MVKKKNSAGKFKCPKNLSKNSCEILKHLDGQEINSLRYEGVVGVKGNKLIQGGKVIATINTNKKASELMSEAFYDEFGYLPGSKQYERAMKEEFG